jgi:hypothetical protein
MIFKIFSPKNWVKNGVFCLNYYELVQKLEHNISFFRKTQILCPKIVIKIAEFSDHSIDIRDFAPRRRCLTRHQFKCLKQHSATLHSSTLQKFTQTRSMGKSD